MDGYNPAQRKPRRPWATTVLAIWAIFATVFGLYTFFSPGSSTNLDQAVPSGKRNVIFMVSDGMGPASTVLARNFMEHQLYGDEDDNTHRGGHISDLTTTKLDKYIIGNSRTQSSDSYITDSAAGATAFACAIKSYNGAIAVDKDGLPCATIFEAAKLAGYKTGLVVTTRITDATPASWAAHAHDRSEEDFIAEQLVNHNGAHPFGSMVDLLLGGGRCHFLPREAPGSCRRDDANLIERAVEDGWTYAEEISGLDEMDLPFLGLFGNGDMPFSIDHEDDSLPRLNDTALAAVHALAEATKDSDQGFFLMVEGSRIDHAGHSNDAAAQVHEVLHYADVIDALAKFVEDSDVPTILVSTSDHETGGLSVSKQVTPEYPDYLWKPEVLAHAKHSTAYLSDRLRHYVSRKPLSEKKVLGYIATEIVGENGLGFTDVTDDELALVFQHRQSAHDVLTQMLSVRAQTGWATHGHSGVDVNVYGASNYPRLLDPIRGPNENIDLGKFVGDFLGLNKRLAPLTKLLRKKFGDKF